VLGPQEAPLFYLNKRISSHNSSIYITEKAKVMKSKGVLTGVDPSFPKYKPIST